MRNLKDVVVIDIVVYFEFAEFRVDIFLVVKNAQEDKDEEHGDDDFFAVAGAFAAVDDVL